MSSLLNSCSDCASLLYTSCDDIVIEAGLTADTAYWWIVTDQFGNRWKNQATTDVNGVLTIYQYFFPPGFLTPGIGSLTLEIKEGENDLENVSLLISGASYDCIEASFTTEQPLGYDDSPTFGLSADYCIDAADTLLVGSETGGTFAGDGVFLWSSDEGGDNNYYFDPNTAGVGAHTVVWSKGATVEQFVVTVHQLPSVSITPADVSVDPNVTPTYTLTGGFPAGGTYFVDDVEATEVDTNAVAKGTHIVRYEYTDGYGCESSAIQTLTIEDVVVETPSPNFVDVICDEFTVTTDGYTTGTNGSLLYYDMYKETCNVNNFRPVFIALHPAAATRTHTNPVTWCEDFCTRGWASFSIDFGHETRGQKFTNSQQKKAVANVCAFIRYLRANAAALGINPDAIILWGKSAGAVVAASVAAAANAVDANKLLPSPTTGYWYYAVNSENPSFSSVPTGSGSESGAINSAIDNYIDAADHAHHFYNGTDDCTVPYSSICGHGPGALENYNAQIALGIGSEFIPFDGYAHDIGDFHAQILTGGAQRVVGVAQLVYADNTFAADIGIVQKFANLIP